LAADARSTNAVRSKHEVSPPRAVILGPPSDGPRAELRGIVEDVTKATGRRYGVRDSADRSIDTAKIIKDPAGGHQQKRPDRGMSGCRDRLGSREHLPDERCSPAAA
jgi:hypothetical protein